MMKRLFLILSSLCLFATMMAKDFVMHSGTRVKVCMPKVERPVAQTALAMFSEDVRKVFGCEVKRVKAAGKADIVLTMDKSLPQEGFRIAVKDGKLYIAGADEHGLAYGLLEVSRKMGVSPWEYWADCTPRPIKEFVLKEGTDEQQSPAVAYRGIFINDEDWGLNPWATRQEPEAWTIREGRIKGAIGPRVNERIFQLMLRLRANYYWPAMHECSQPFFTIEGNREMAARYGIYIGGSHCEPMATSPAAEWALSGESDYNYVTNSQKVKDFWQKRLDEVKDQEIVYTLGMRGVHDGSMQGVKTMDEKVKYLQMVIDDQRKMLTDTHPKGTSVPQVFVPYKEVLDIYKSGLQVPDDVTLMWTDDNYGYIRHFPDSTERNRKGGNGVYYHVSYWGRPHDYLWLNSLSPNLLEQEMGRAYGRGIRKMWILNVGDIKPSEYQIELFMQLAWDGRSYEFFHLEPTGRMFGDSPVMRHVPFLRYFVRREFGKDKEEEIMDVMYTYFRLSEEMKPEHMAGTRVEENDKAYWNTVRPILGDWTKAKIAERVKDYQRISDQAEALYQQMPADRKDAFFQLVKYPVQAAAQMNFKFLCPDRCEAAYDSIQSLTYIYNKVCADGKWDGIMDASPRRLPVFQRVSPDMLPQYPDSSEWEALDFGPRKVLDDKRPYVFTTPLGTDSVTLRVHLRPTHPRDGQRIAFRLAADGMHTADIEYQTYDRSEEWKQNVIRGYAVREVRVPVDSTKTQHQVFFERATSDASLHETFSIFRKK